MGSSNIEIMCEREVSCLMFIGIAIEYTHAASRGWPKVNNHVEILQLPPQSKFN